MTNENLDVADGTDDDLAEIFASPNDTNLTGYLEELVVTSVLSMGEYEVMVILAGGSGFLTINGEVQEYECVKELTLNGAYVDDPKNVEIVQATLGVLEEWRATGMKLQLSAADGKLTTLLDDEGDWVPIPCLLD